MSENQYSFKYDEYGNTQEILVYSSGVTVNSCSFINKGTAFNKSERKRLGLQAILPPGVRQLEDQVENSAKTVDAKVDDIEKYIFIRSLFDRNVTLAHALIQSDFRQFLNIIYTPTVAEVVKRYSSLFRQANGLHFYPGNIDYAEDILRRFIHRDIRVAVVTDNQGILGLGDQGVGGITICLGKLMLYSQVAGVAPWHCLPISLDVGTDNEDLLEDEKYLGWRQKRLKGEEYLAFIGRFARAFRNVFPNALCQWEDFSKQNAFSIRDAFSEELISFNDDIQGSGAVALAAVLTGLKRRKEKLESQVFLINGAGTVGIGIARQIEQSLIDRGVGEEEARDAIFTFDSEGLVSTERSVEHFKARYAKNPDEFDWISESTSIETVISNAGVTVYIDTVRDGSVFKKEDVKALIKNTEIPIILPLSGATDQAQVHDLYELTGGKALVCTGFSYEDMIHERKTRQCHNVLAFPGVGLGILASGARETLPEFFTVAAEVLSKSVREEDREKGALLPSLSELENVTLKVALGVAMAAVKAGISRPCVYSGFQHLDDEVRMKDLISKMRWKPEYLPLVAM